MPVRVDEISSDVSVEPAPGAREQGEQRPWDKLAAFAALRLREAEDAARTRAVEFDD